VYEKGVRLIIFIVYSSSKVSNEETCTPFFMLYCLSVCVNGDDLIDDVMCD
jgi:hypothetical protein